MTTSDLLALAFDQYQRYTVVQGIANLVREHLAQPRLRVLDVGGFFRTRCGDAILPLVHFLPLDQVVAVDLVAETLPDYVLSSGQSLPFPDRAFPLVASCDTLEHVPPANRAAFVDELLRVAGHCLVLIAPFNGPARQAEEIVYKYLKSQGLEHDAFREHIELGLPDAGALRANLVERGLLFVEFPDGYLHHWLLMMLIKHTPGTSLEFQLDLDRYYNRYLSPEDRREPAYRRVFVIARPGNENLLPSLAERFRPLDSPPSKPLFDVVADLISVLKRAQDITQAEELQRAAGQLDDARLQLSDVAAENLRLRQTIAAYERGRFIRFMRWVHRWREKPSTR
jgi:hypothetical protein